MRGSTSVPLSSLDTGQVKPDYGIALWFVIWLVLPHNIPTKPMLASMKPRGESHAGCISLPLSSLDPKQEYGIKLFG